MQTMDMDSTTVYLLYKKYYHYIRREMICEFALDATIASRGRLTFGREKLKTERVFGVMKVQTDTHVKRRAVGIVAKAVWMLSLDIILSWSSRSTAGSPSQSVPSDNR